MEVTKALEVGFLMNGCDKLCFPDIASSFLKTHNHSQRGLGEMAGALIAYASSCIYKDAKTGHKNLNFSLGARDSNPAQHSQLQLAGVKITVQIKLCPGIRQLIGTA